MVRDWYIESSVRFLISTVSRIITSHSKSSWRGKWNAFSWGPILALEFIFRTDFSHYSCVLVPPGCTPDEYGVVPEGQPRPKMVKGRISEEDLGQNLPLKRVQLPWTCLLLDFFTFFICHTNDLFLQNENRKNSHILNDGNI